MRRRKNRRIIDTLRASTYYSSTTDTLAWLLGRWINYHDGKARFYPGQLLLSTASSSL